MPTSSYEVGCQRLEVDQNLIDEFSYQPIVKLYDGGFLPGDKILRFSDALQGQEVCGISHLQRGDRSMIDMLKKCGIRNIYLVWKGDTYGVSKRIILTEADRQDAQWPREDHYRHPSLW